jgi:NAD(P)-dependent dehydrogenase (short-subunit alcohol dehydrogenase family)
MADRNTRKTALVTGAAKRIGRAIALDMAAHGWSIAVHYNTSPREAEETRDAIRKTGAAAETVRGDLRDTGALAGLLDRARKALGPVTCLINNASVFDHDDIATVTPEGWEEHIAVNLRAPLFLSQLFAAALPAERDGAIVNLIDQRVRNLTPHFFSYTISKAGLWTATRTLAQALAPRIRVNAVSPGPTLPNVRQRQEDFARESSTTLLGRGPEPEEIAAAVRFILDAPSLTGQMITLDGGQHLVWQTPDLGTEQP